MHRLLFVLAFGLTAVSLSAQDPGSNYRRTPGDTLRYHEVTTSTTEFTTPQGTVPLESSHDARMSIAFGTADTAYAWYDVLQVSARSPQGERTPSTAGALGMVFVLLIDRQGSIQTLSAPEFPDEFEGVTDLTRQFDDYLVPVRPHALRMGAEWTDTLAMRDSTAAGRVYAMHRVRSHRVRGDTVVGGERLLVLQITSTDSLDVKAPGARPGVSICNVMRGTEQGIALLSPQRGVLVSRSREGEYSGEMHLLGGAQPTVVPMRRRFTNTLQLLP